MALHHQLPIYKLASDLASLAADLTKNMPRDFKRTLGEKYVRMGRILNGGGGRSGARSF